jgi:hypothetical protein
VSGEPVKPKRDCEPGAFYFSVYCTPMSSASSTNLPSVVVSSVVRSTHQGESHGGVYLVDLQTSAMQQVLNWDDTSISWEGRGADRGLRGMAFHGGLVYMAASDEIFIYDRQFAKQGSFTNRYLRHCHEISVEGDSLYLTSTGFDCVLEYDLQAGAFRRGYCLRFPGYWRTRRRWNLHPRPRFTVFDPNRDGGPPPGDTSHINNVFSLDGRLYVCGTGLGTVWCIAGGILTRFAKVPYGSHNARPFREGVLLNHTATDRIGYFDRRGTMLRSFAFREYQEEELLNASLPRDIARQAFGRGLAVVSDDLFVGGSSPATVTAYAFDPPEVVRSVNLTMDVRHAVHGLEVWPFQTW